MFSLVAVVLRPAAGAWIDRQGVRRALLPGATLMVLSLARAPGGHRALGLHRGDGRLRGGLRPGDDGSGGPGRERSARTAGPSAERLLLGSARLDGRGSAARPLALSRGRRRRQFRDGDCCSAWSLRPSASRRARRRRVAGWPRRSVPSPLWSRGALPLVRRAGRRGHGAERALRVPAAPRHRLTVRSGTSPGSSASTRPE